MATVYAKSSLSTTTEHGVIIKLHVGEAWDSNDPLVKLRPELFGGHPPRVRTSNGWVEPTIETATAAPGEKRRGKRK